MKMTRLQKHLLTPNHLRYDQSTDHVQGFVADDSDSLVGIMPVTVALQQQG